MLIVQGVLMTRLAKAADIVLPGAAWVEKDATYVNGQGRLQAAARVIAPPGEAQEDWQMFVDVALALGAAVGYASSAEIRAERRRGACPATRVRRRDEPGLRAARCGAAIGCRRRTRPSGGSGT